MDVFRGVLGLKGQFRSIFSNGQPVRLLLGLLGRSRICSDMLVVWSQVAYSGGELGLASVVDVEEKRSDSLSY